MSGQNKIRSIHGGYGGYNATLAARLASVKLPEETQCCECNKTRSTRFFSQGQLNLLRQGILSRQVNDPTGPWIKCMNCTGKQVTELRCIICRQWMSLDAFAKAQRRGGDNARCLNCVADHLETQTLDTNVVVDAANRLYDPDGEGDDSDTETNVNTCNTTQSGVPIPASMIDSLNEQNIQRMDRTSLGGSSKVYHGAAPKSTSAINRWQAAARFDGTSSHGLGESHHFTGYDSKGQAHSRTHAPSEAQSDNDDSEEYSEDSKLSAEDQKKLKDENAKFARQKGGRGFAIIRPTTNDTGRTVAREDDSDEDPDSDEEFAL